MDAVAAPDGGRVPVFKRAFLQPGQQLIDIADQNIGSALQLDRQAGVQHIGRGHALMHEARLGADDFGQMGEEGDNVVLHLALDLVDAGDAEFGPAAHGPDFFRCLFRDHAKVCQRIGGMGLDLEPDAEFGFGRPDRHHVRPCVTRNHSVIFPIHQEPDI